MFRRLFIASILSFALAVPTAGIAASAATAVTGSVSQATGTVQTATQAPSAPMVDCQPIINPVCRLICPHCTVAATAPGSAAPATAEGARSASSSRFVCSPAFQVVCFVLGQTLCRIRPCFESAATSSAVAAFEMTRRS